MTTLTPKASVEHASKMAFQKSFSRLNDDQMMLNTILPKDVSDGMDNIFNTFCSLVEHGVRHSLLNQAEEHSGPVESNTSGNHCLNTKGSRVDTLSPVKLRNRNLRRVSTGRVRPLLGHNAACYFSRDGFKLKFTVEARLHTDSLWFNNGTIENGSLSLIRISRSSSNVDTNKREEESVDKGDIDAQSTPVATSHQQPIPTITCSTDSTATPINNQETIKDSIQGLTGLPTALWDQANEVQEAISSMIRDMPRQIPGTPVIIVFNAIVTHTNSSSSAESYKKAYSFQGVAAIKDSKTKLLEKQAVLEQSYKAQGVNLKSTLKSSGVAEKYQGWFPFGRLFSGKTR